MSTAMKAAAITKPVNEVTVVQCDDWIALFVDGKKVIEGHSLNETDIFRAIGVEMRCIWLEDEWVEEHGFPETLDNLPQG
jgi:hypothetical protein